MSIPELAYWDIRGLAQPIRLLLHHVQQKFNDKQYVCGPAPTFDRSAYLNDKEKLLKDHPMMNLPYYREGDFWVFQSNAIMRHLARKHKLDGDTEEERAKADMVECAAYDWRNAWVRLCYGAFDEQKDSYHKTTLPSTLGIFSRVLGKQSYFAGEKVTYVDFIVYELLDQHLMCCPDILSDYANLAAFQKRIAELPHVSAFLKSKECIRDRINNRMAKFGAGDSK